MKEFCECFFMIGAGFILFALPVVMFIVLHDDPKKVEERHEKYTNEMKKAVRQAVYDIYLDMKKNEDL